MKAIFMKNMRVIVLLLLSLLCIPGFGQIYKYIGLEDGLSSRNVYAVQQSNGGFIRKNKNIISRPNIYETNK